MLGEPPRSQGDLNFPLLGIPVRIHPMFWLVGALLGLSTNDPVKLLIWVAALLVAILVHELGHALVARAYGMRPWITLYGFGGLTSFDPRTARRRMDTWDDIAVSAAGPGAGFLLAAAVLVALRLAGRHVEINFGIPILFVEGFSNKLVNAMVFDVLRISIFWGLINLLPIYPLDGGQIARELFLRYGRDGIRRSLVLSLAAAVGMAAITFFRWHDMYLGIFFAYFAVTNWITLQAYSGRRLW